MAQVPLHPTFPEQTTTDQFFDEAQFEAYRELGYGTGRYVFEQKTLEEIFTDKDHQGGQP